MPKRMTEKDINKFREEVRSLFYDRFDRELDYLEFHTDGPYHSKYVIAWDRVKEGARGKYPIYSPVHGTVTAVHYDEETRLYSVSFFTQSTDPHGRISHLKIVSVTAGEKITPGRILGFA